MPPADIRDTAAVCNHPIDGSTGHERSHCHRYRISVRQYPYERNGENSRRNRVWLHRPPTRNLFGLSRGVWQLNRMARSLDICEPAPNFDPFRRPTVTPASGEI